MKFSALLLIAIVASAAPGLQSAPRVIDPSQHNPKGSRVWAGKSIGFLTIVSDVPSANLPPSDAKTLIPEEPQVIEAKNGTIWWGFKILPPLADYSNATFATSNDNRIWVSFKANAIPSEASLVTVEATTVRSVSEQTEGIVDARIWKGYPAANGHVVPVEETLYNVPADADAPDATGIKPRIWWGYPEGDWGKSRSFQPSEMGSETSTSTAASVKGALRIWWGYPEGDFGKWSKSLKQASSNQSISTEEAEASLVGSENNIYWVLPPKDAQQVPEKAVIGHDASGRVWWGYPIDANKETKQSSDGGIAADRDGTQYRIWWGNPSLAKNDTGKNETAAASLAAAVSLKGTEARESHVTTPTPSIISTKKKSSLFGAIKDLLPLGQAEVDPTDVTVEVPKNGEQAAVGLSAVKKGEVEREHRAAALISIVAAQTDDVLREELGNVADHLLDDLNEYRLNAAAAQNAKGNDVDKTEAATAMAMGPGLVLSASTGAGNVAPREEKESLGKEDMSKRFEELKAKYEKLLNVVGESA